MPTVRLVAINTPLEGKRDPRILPILGVKTSTGKVIEKGLEHYLNSEWKEAWGNWVKVAKEEFPSVLEHITLTFFVDGISRVASHQLVRHRLVSFTQESQRYTEARIRKAFAAFLEAYYKDEPSKRLAEYIRENDDEAWLRLVVINFKEILDSPLKCNHPAVRKFAHKLFVVPRSLEQESPTLQFLMLCHLIDAVMTYAKARITGVSMEDARYLLPQSIKTSLLATANLREWNHIIELRCHPKAQWEIREVACAIKNIIEAKLGPEFVVNTKTNG